MELTEFLAASYTPFHTAANVKRMLTESGFLKADLGALRKGGKYYVENEGAIIAFRLGGEFVYHIVESHTDSPCLKIKGVCEEGEHSRFNVEKYGGGILSSYLDRKLKVAGRLVVREDGALRSLLYDSPYYAVAPSLAPHFGGPEGVTAVSTQLFPLAGAEKRLIPECVDFDLFAVPCEAPFYAGANKEYLCAPRLDNLLSVYGSVRALLAAEPAGISVCACFDSEETGSQTARGAGAEFFPRILRAIAAVYGQSDPTAAEGSLALSADNAHAAHPAFPEKSDPFFRTRLNGGIAIKHHTNYATDGAASAIVKTIFRDAGVPFQDYYHHADLRCGSTLGLIAAANIGIRTCDVGAPQLGMHSALETVGASAPDQLERLFTAFYQNPIPKIGD